MKLKIINENKLTRKVCDMKSLCCANIKTQSLNKSAYTNFQLTLWTHYASSVNQT